MTSRIVRRSAVSVKSLVTAISGCDRLQRPRQDGELARHRATHHQPLALVGDLRERLAPSGHPCVDLCERRRMVRVDKHTIDDVHESVAGGPGDRPRGRKRLAVPEDLLGHEVKRAVSRPDLGDGLLKTRKIRSRIPAGRQDDRAAGP